MLVKKRPVLQARACLSPDINVGHGIASGGVVAAITLLVYFDCKVRTRENWALSMLTLVLHDGGANHRH